MIRPALVLPIILLSGCDSVGRITEPAAEILLSAAGATLDVGDSVQIRTMLTGASGSPLCLSPCPSARVTWVSADPNVATVSTSGVITALMSGSTVITAVSGQVSASMSVVVKERAHEAIAHLSLAPKYLSISAVPGEAVLTVTAFDVHGRVVSEPSVTWATTQPTVARVDTRGVAAASREGTTLITVIAGGLIATAEVVVRRSVHSIPATIASDCSVDVTQALRVWIASVPNNSTLKFGTNACYRIDGGLVINDRVGLTFEGNGSTFQVFTQGHGQRANWIVRGGSNLTLRNMIARGANPNAGLAENAYVRSLEWQHGYRLRGVQGAVLDNVQAYDVYGDYVNLSHDDRVTFPGPPNRNIVVRNGRFERNGRYGFTITNAEDVVFENNYLGETRWSHINVELNGKQEQGRNVRIEGNQFGRANHHMIVSSGAGLTGHVGNFVIRGNTMVADPPSCLAPIVFGAPEGWTNPDGSSVYWDGFVIENNNLRLQTGGWGIHLLRIRDVVIRNNQMASHTHSGCSQDHVINLVDSHRVQITGNTFTTAYLAHGRFWIHTYRADALSSAISEAVNVLR
jgi:hypothetical protein